MPLSIYFSARFLALPLKKLEILKNSRRWQTFLKIGPICVMKLMFSSRLHTVGLLIEHKIFTFIKNVNKVLNYVDLPTVYLLLHTANYIIFVQLQCLYYSFFILICILFSCIHLKIWFLWIYFIKCTSLHLPTLVILKMIFCYPSILSSVTVLTVNNGSSKLYFFII